MRIELALSAIGIAFSAMSVPANGGDLPSAVELGNSPVSTAPARGLDGLSPGNRLIAQALYRAQKSVTASGLQAWSLERIALERAGGRHWGEVFQQLKRDGLVEAETLGQVVTWFQYHNVTPTQYQTVAPTRATQEPGSTVAVKVVNKPKSTK